MSHNSVLLFIVLALVSGSVVRSQCYPSGNPAATPLNAPLPTSNMITFDDLGLQSTWYGSSGPLSLSQGNQSIAVFQQGTPGYVHCAIVNGSAGYRSMSWNSTVVWSGSATEMPGFFMQGLTAGLCTLQFIPPITAFVARVNYATAWATPVPSVQIYDPQAQSIECQDLPTLPGVNTYKTIGYASTVPIGYINFFAPNVPCFIDNLQYLTCDQGFRFNGTECVDIDECSESPCQGYNVTCSNTPGSFECVCDEGFEKNNGTCVDIDECTTLLPCSSFATCLNNEGGYTCTCNDGYTGNGVGPNGCQAVAVPSDNNNSPSESNSPSSINNPSDSPSSPSASNSPSKNNYNSPSSSQISNGNSIFVNSMLLMLVLAMIM